MARGQGFFCSHVLKRIILITISEGLLEIVKGKACWIMNDYRVGMTQRLNTTCHENIIG